MRRLLVVLLALAVAAPAALAATRSEHKFKLTFTSATPAANTGIKFLTDRFDYEAPKAGEKADTVATTTFIMQKGTKTNTSAVPNCSKATLVAEKPENCPKGSKVGSGKAWVITGLPSVDKSTGLEEEAQIFAGKGRLFAYLTGLRTTVIELPMKGNRIIAAVPRLCLVDTEKNCESGEAVLKKLQVSIKPSKGLIKTPRTCPASGKWTNSVQYRYANGDAETVKSTSRCKR
jgi:hypothetical protein